jgi:hypothetical protein
VILLARVYLSPSLQNNNVGVGAYGTEKYRMNLLTDQVQARLQAIGVEVFRNRPSDDLSAAIIYGNSLNVDCYVSLHSNAIAGPINTSTRGPEMLINGNRTNSQRLGKAIYDSYMQVSPTKGRGLKVRNDLGEILNAVAPSCLFEVAFHDQIDDANWIINNMPIISEAIANGIVAYLNSPTTPDNTGTINQDAVLPQKSYDVSSPTGKDTLFGRKFRILIDVGGGTAIDISQLKCVFRASKTVLMEPNMSTVSIYNLDAETENKIIKSGKRLVIEAGYSGSSFGVIFDGDIVQPTREKVDGTDYVLHLLCLDGDRFMQFGFVSYVVGKGMSSRDVLNQVVKNSTVPVEIGTISRDLSQSKLTRGKVLFGFCKDYIDKVASMNDATFYVENGKVNLTKAEDLPEGTIYKLSSTSGLIGTPEQEDYGLRFKSLIIPNLKLNSLVNIDNSVIKEAQVSLGQIRYTLDVDGLYKIVSIEYVGDTRGNDWYAECFAITQSGKIPSMLNSTGTSNIW